MKERKKKRERREKSGKKWKRETPGKEQFDEAARLKRDAPARL